MEAAAAGRMDLYWRTALRGRRGALGEMGERTCDDPRNSSSRKGELCSHCRRDARGRTPVTSPRSCLLPCRSTDPPARPRSRRACEGKAATRLRNPPDYTQSRPCNRPLEVPPRSRRPSRNRGRPGLLCRRRLHGYHSRRRMDNPSTSGRVSRRQSSPCALPFPGRCEADWWTAERSSACLVGREKTRVRLRSCDTKRLLSTTQNIGKAFCRQSCPVHHCTGFTRDIGNVLGDDFQSTWSINVGKSRWMLLVTRAESKHSHF